MRWRPPNWFGRAVRDFAPVAEMKAGQPVNYVEIGVWIGGSAAWVCQHVLTHPESTGWGIDPYIEMPGHSQEEMDNIREIARLAMQRHVDDGRWRWVYQPSAKALREWDQPIDLLYIDGQHYAHAVMIDFALAWEHLRPGAIVIFDDYRSRRRKRHRNVPFAVAAVQSAFGDLITEVRQGHTQWACRVDRKNYKHPRRFYRKRRREATERLQFIREK